MNDLENGYVYVDDNGYGHFLSYDTVGGGIGAIIFMVAVTIFVKSINDFLLINKWVIIIPTLISVIIRTLISDAGLTLKKRIINIIGDTAKSLCMYSILLIIIDTCANAHWLDRFLFALFFGAIFFVADWLINLLLKFLRTPRLYILHLIACLAVSAIALSIYSAHTWYWQGYDYTVSFNKATIVKVDERMEGTIEIPDSIYNYTVENIGEDAFRYNKKVTYVELPDTIKSIKENAFGFNPSFNGIKIPKSVKTIEKSLWSYDYDFDIYYEGSQEDWAKIDIQDENIKALTVHFNCE